MMRDLLLKKWAQVRTGLLDTIAKFEDAELGYRPFDKAYSAGELMLHVAHEENIEMRYAPLPQFAKLPPAYVATSYADKASIVAVLTAPHAATVSYREGLNDHEVMAEVELPWGQTARRIDMLWHVLEHEVHHRAELSLMLGLLGREGLDAWPNAPRNRSRTR